MKVYCEEEEEEIKNICKLCNRNFSSIKALYGHMRSHPDRSWRGIKPPTSIISSSNSSTISSSSNSSSLSLPSWSLTARRGRKGIGSDSAFVAASSSSSATGVEQVAEPKSLFALAGREKEKYNNNVKKRKKMSEIGYNEIQDAKKVYKCNCCGKGFGSHQALGGHRSSHYKARIIQLSHSTQERRILNFDLNELPPDDDDNGDNNNGGEGKQT